MEGSTSTARRRWRIRLRRFLQILADILLFLLGGPPDPPSKHLPKGRVRSWF